MHSKRLGWIFLAPTLVILFFFGVVPFVYVVFVSFHQWNPFAVNPEMVFNGADNFRRIVFDQAFLNSLGATVLFVVFAVFSQLVLGYLLAQAFMRDFPGKAIFRTIHTLPLIMAPIIVGSVWKLMTTPSIKPQIFWHITLPMIAPAMIATVFIRLMDALRTVDEVWMLTGGGPGSATRFLGVHIFREVFPKTNYGYGSTISVIVLYLTIVACWLLYVTMLAPRTNRGSEEE